MSRASWLSICVAVLPLLGASSVNAVEPGKPGGTLVIISTQVPRHFNSAVQSGIATMVPAAQIFAFLVRADADWHFHPYLAKSWEISPDGLTVKFHLREDARFQDGVPITSADVKYSIEVQKANHPFKTSLGAVKTVETPDAHTVVLRLSQPHPALLLAMSTSIVPIIPKHIYDDGQDIRNHPRNTQDVVGSGPFRLKEYKQGEYIILEKNPDFFIKGRPYLDRIIIKIIRDQPSAVLSMQKGEGDMFPFLESPLDIDRLQKDPDLVVTNKGYAAIGPNNWLAFNTKKPPLNDVRVRQAIAYAIDRNFIVKALLRGKAEPSTGPIVPESPFYTADAEKYDLNLDKAKQLLDEAGYKPNGDGVRMSLNVNYIPGAPDEQANVAEYIRPQLKKIGINVQVQNSPDFPTWAKQISNWDFDMTMDQVYNWGDPVIGVHRTYLCDNIKQGVIWSNTQQYCNPKVDSLLDAAGKELNPAKRKALYVEFQKIVAQDVPIYWLNVVPYYTAYKKNLGNPPLTIWGTVSPMDEVYWK